MGDTSFPRPIGGRVCGHRYRFPSGPSIRLAVGTGKGGGRPDRALRLFATTTMEFCNRQGVLQQILQQTAFVQQSQPSPSRGKGLVGRPPLVKGSVDE